MDATVLGLFASQVMEKIGEDFDGDADIRTVAIVVEVDTGEDTHILVACDEDRPWVQKEFLHQAIDTLEIQMTVPLDEED